MKGPDLTAIFLSKLESQGINVEKLEHRVGKAVYVNIANQTCYLKHANQSISGNFYFGFALKDMEKSGLVKKAILLCGRGGVDDIFIMDFNYFASLIKAGRPVRKRRADYEEYQATIFPKRDYIMTVTNRRRDPVDMNVFRAAVSEVVARINA